MRPFVLAADAEALDDALITRLVAAFDIVQKFPAQRHHFEQTTARMIIFFVGFEVLGQSYNPRGQNGNLNFGGTSVPFLNCKFFHYAGFFLYCNRHRGLLLIAICDGAGRDVVQQGPWRYPPKFWADASL